MLPSGEAMLKCKKQVLETLLTLVESCQQRGNIYVSEGRRRYQ